MASKGEKKARRMARIGLTAQAPKRTLSLSWVVNERGALSLHRKWLWVSSS